MAGHIPQLGITPLTHSLTAALDQLRVVASSTSNDPGPRSRQHQQIGQCLLPIAAANSSVDDPAGASSQQREECRCGLLLTVAVPAKQVCSPVDDRCDQIMNDYCVGYLVIPSDTKDRGNVPNMGTLRKNHVPIYI